MEEIWKPVVGYEGLYEVSSLGRVRSLDKWIYDPFCEKRFLQGRIMKSSLRGKEGKSHPFVVLFKDGVRKNCSVHVLVATAFIPNPEGKRFIDHIDTNMSNNVVTNLRWVTYKENQNNPLTRQHLSENNPNKKRVGMYSEDGTLLEEFESATRAAQVLRSRGTKADECNILAVCNRRSIKCRDGVYRERKKASGFIWRFIE